MVEMHARLIRICSVRIVTTAAFDHITMFLHNPWFIFDIMAYTADCRTRSASHHVCKITDYQQCIFQTFPIRPLTRSLTRFYPLISPSPPLLLSSTSIMHASRPASSHGSVLSLSLTPISGFSHKSAPVLYNHCFSSALISLLVLFVLPPHPLNL